MHNILHIISTHDLQRHPPFLTDVVDVVVWEGLLGCICISIHTYAVHDAVHQCIGAVQSLINQLCLCDGVVMFALRLIHLM